METTEAARRVLGRLDLMIRGAALADPPLTKIEVARQVGITYRTLQHGLTAHTDLTLLRYLELCKVIDADPADLMRRALGG